MKFDEMIGAFSSRYEETVYMLGFHDGLGMGLEHREYRNGGIQGRKNGSVFTEQDMVHLIYMYDAYRELCTALLGRVVVPELKDGVIGAFCRTLAVIEDHIPADKKGEDDPEYDRLLHNRKKSPEERARLLIKAEA